MKRTSRPRRNAPSEPTYERTETISGAEVKFFSMVQGDGYKNWSFTIDGGPMQSGPMSLLYVARENAKKAIEALRKKRDKSTGKYVHEGGWERLCVCGHSLGEHTAATVGGKRPCIHDDFHAPVHGGAHDGESCNCERYRPSKKKKVEANALTSDKDLQKIIRAAEKEGWTVEVTGGGHLVFKAPDRGVPPIYTAKSPSDWRGLKNLRSTLKRHGLVANVFPEDVHPNVKPPTREMGTGRYAHSKMDELCTCGHPLGVHAHSVSPSGRRPCIESAEPCECEQFRPARVRRNGEEHRGVPYLVEAMPDGEWRWEALSTTGYESDESEARDAARRTIERRLAARSM